LANQPWGRTSGSTNAWYGIKIAWLLGYGEVSTETFVAGVQQALEEAGPGREKLLEEATCDAMFAKFNDVIREQGKLVFEAEGKKSPQG